MFRIFIVFLLATVANTALNAQNILSFIPKSSKSITVVKGNRIDEIYQLNQIIKQETYQDFEENFEENSEETWYGLNVISRYNGAQMGVNNLTKYYTFKESNDSLRIYASVFEVSSKSTLETFIEEAVGEDKWKEKANSGTFEYLVNDENAIAWNGQFFIYYSGRVMYGYINSLMQDDSDYYLEELSEKEKSERDVQREKIKEDLVKKDLLRLLSLDFEDAILSKRQFMELLSKDYDSFIYTSSSLTDLGSAPREPYVDYDRYGYDAYDYEYIEEETEPNSLLTGNYSYNFWKFDQELLTNKVHFALNPDLFKHFKKITGAKFNKNYRKYISGDNIMGYYSLALNPKHTMQLLKDLSFNYGNYIPGFRGSTQRIMSLLGGIIDKKKALKIFKGDMLFVITDMKEVDVRYESFAYNKEDHVREKIIKTKKEKRPEFIFMTSSGYHEFVSNALDMLEKERRLVKMGDYYRLIQKKNRYSENVKDGSVDTYLAFVDGILIVTNNESTVTDYLQKGYPEAAQLSKEKFADMVDDNLNVFWDIEGANGFSDSDDMEGIPQFTRGFLSTHDDMFGKYEENGMDLIDNTAILNGTYELKKEDRELSTLHLLDMLTGLTESPDVFLGDKY